MSRRAARTRCLAARRAKCGPVVWQRRYAGVPWTIQMPQIEYTGTNEEIRMRYVNLGRTGLKVSRLCLGTMNYGPHVSEDVAHAQMDAAIELGINFFDTADVYGDSKGKGTTETIIGNWFAQGNCRREKT